MRERRWETSGKLEFGEVLAVGERLASLGLAPARPAKEIICYIEEWGVEKPDAFDRVDPWVTEDVTLVLLHDEWRGDFFLLAGGYHTVYQRHRSIGTYCSVSHPWVLSNTFSTVAERAMFWLGFRHSHGFIRVRLNTSEVITPGETRADDQREVWLQERAQAFVTACRLLALPIRVVVQRGHVSVEAEERGVPLFCSWPDAFGPCQFEYNTPDPFEFLVPASRLAATCNGEPVTIRAYLTGFSESALEEFQAVEPRTRLAYRASAHCVLDDVPELLRAIEPAGRLYATLCEFQTQLLRPDGHDAAAIVGLVGGEESFQIEVRLNRAPLPEKEMGQWLEHVLGMPVTYAPLPAFP